MRPINFNDEEVCEICRQNDVETLALFGSYARGEEKDDSDIDLLARFSRPKSLLSVVTLQRELSQALHRRVDLLTEQAISPYLRERFLSELRVVYHA